MQFCEFIPDLAFALSEFFRHVDLNNDKEIAAFPRDSRQTAFAGEIAGHPECPAEFLSARCLPELARPIRCPTRRATARSSPHGSSHCLRPKNRDAAPDAREEIDHHFFPRARRLRPGRASGYAALREHRAESLPGNFPLCLSLLAVAKLFGWIRATLLQV